MGWDFTRGASKQDIVESRTRTREWPGHRRETLKSTVVGNTLWAIQRLSRLDVDGNVAEKEDNTPEQETFIACYLLDNDPGFGWGYKDMCEEMNPYYYDCPLSYLDMAPEKSPEWRAGVRKFHQDKREKEQMCKQAVASLEIGQLVKLVNGCSPGMVKLVSLKPLLGEFGGQQYRIKRSLLAPAEEQAAFRAQMAEIDRKEEERLANSVRAA